MIRRISTFALSGALVVAVATIALHDTARAQSDLEETVDRGFVRVGAVHAPPYYRKDPETNEWGGLVPDIMEAMFSEIDIDVRYVETQWGTAVAGLQSEKFDLIGAYNATPQRALAIDFTEPIGFLRVGVVTLGEDTGKWQSWDEIANSDATIVAVDGAATTNAAERVLGDRVNWVRVKSNDQMLLELESNRADLALSNHPTLIKYMDQRGKGEMVIPEPEIQQPTNVGLRKSDSNSLREWLNVAIAYLDSNKVLESVWQKHLPTE